jgi:proline iminopeptidase
VTVTVTARERHIPVGDARIFVREIGDGPPILVLHGGPDFDHGYLLPELDGLASSCRLVYYDQRGRGRSGDGVRASDVTIASDIADIDHVRRAFGLDTMTVLGHSWGCVLAMEFAARDPEHISHLVLLNTAPGSRADVATLRAHLARIRPPGDAERMRAIAATDRFRRGDLDADEEYYRIHFAPAVTDPARLDLLLPRLRAHVDAEGVVTARAIEDRLYDETWRDEQYDVTARLHTLAVPTLVIHGDRDFIPVEVAEHVAAAIPGAVLDVLPACGHFSFLDAPDEVRERVAAFVRTP